MTKGEMLDSITNSMDMSLSKLWQWPSTGKPAMLHGVAKSQTRLSYQTD